MLMESLENLYLTRCIRTVSGKYIDVFDPTPDMICIEDIAHSLSNMPRFGGHLPYFYSVAQHSLWCAQEASEPNKLAALLHDTTEAYILDFPSPIKKEFPEYKKMEDKLMKVIAAKFNIQYPFHPEIKEIDKKALHFEWNSIMLAKQKPLYTELSRSVVKDIFVAEFFNLVNK